MQKCPTVAVWVIAPQSGGRVSASWAWGQLESSCPCPRMACLSARCPHHCSRNRLLLCKAPGFWEAFLVCPSPGFHPTVSTKGEENKANRKGGERGLTSPSDGAFLDSSVLLIQIFGSKIGWSASHTEDGGTVLPEIILLNSHLWVSRSKRSA